MGRDAGCHIRFDPEQERVVGRRHAHIEARPDGIYLIDDNSANGTFKDGQPLSELRLQHGDRFQLGGEVEGAQGPWISVHMPVAVHVAPPRTDAATIISRPGTAAATSSAPAAPGAVPAYAEATGTAAPSPPPAPPSPPVFAYSPAPAQSELDSDLPRRRPGPALGSSPARPELLAESPDPQARRRRDQWVRQLVTIVLLLVLASVAGATLGLSLRGDADAERSRVN